MTIVTVLGTRPEAIKLAPVIRELRRRSSQAERRIRVCVTGQHRELLDQVLTLFDLVPDEDLKIMEEGQSPAQVASLVLARLEPVLARERPDWVLVQGDTTTAAATAQLAFYSGIKVAHVEAGLRTYDKQHPFPEELNRRMIGLIADLHFAPTERARRNLLQEGVPSEHVIVTGNSAIDALRWAVQQPVPPQTAALLRTAGLESLLLAAAGGRAARGSGDEPEGFILVTAHRRENFGRGLEEICLALKDLALHYGNRVRIIYSVHLNPRAREPVHRLLRDVPTVILTPPLDYLAFVHLMPHARLVLTDSGGIQEEALALGVPLLVTREATERPEGVEIGTARLVGTERARIVAETRRLLDDPAARERVARAANAYGDGHASRRIVAALFDEPVDSFVSSAIA